MAPKHRTNSISRLMSIPWIAVLRTAERAPAPFIEKAKSEAGIGLLRFPQNLVESIATLLGPSMRGTSFRYGPLHEAGGIAAIQLPSSATPSASDVSVGTSGILSPGSVDFTRKIMIESSGLPGRTSYT